ncbi:M48 family metallopeptidase [Microlunatus speluncae]|uniref:M48 family metallopeptidase n=1 Tax=Microlunatus speluncae TaxID=2594267 RepID=UPI00126657D3|nr:M48 family metallopeptidase [Microlunatus speluncae]
MTDETPRPGRIRFPDISPRAYEHPADRGALVALRAIPGFDQVLKAISGAIGERSVRLLFLATSIRVSPRQFPELHQVLTECATTLDLDPVPELYVTRDPMPNAMAIGLDKPIVVITTGMIDLLDHEGLRFIIGHEVGHVLSGHALYRTMMLQLIAIANSIQWMPIGVWGLRAIILGLNEWFRKSELSCDRAGLLCGQDPKAALRVHAALAGAKDPDEMDVSGFLAQATEYESGGDIRDSFLKILQTADLTHPMAALRAAELQKWVAGNGYADILAGNYPRRSEDKDAPLSEDVKAAAASYRQDFQTSADPLFKVMNKAGSVIGGVSGSAANRVRDWWKSGPGAGRPSNGDR